MLLMESVITLLLAAAFVHFQVTRRKNSYQTSILLQHINPNEELKRTIAMRLYLRFKKGDSDNPIKYSSIYIKQDLTPELI